MLQSTSRRQAASPLEGTHTCHSHQGASASQIQLMYVLFMETQEHRNSSRRAVLAQLSETLFFKLNFCSQLLVYRDVKVGEKKPDLITFLCRSASAVVLSNANKQLISTGLSVTLSCLMA